MQIIIEPRTTPVCACGGSDWDVAQTLQQSAKLIRVDGLSDLLIEKPDPITFTQSLTLLCRICGDVRKPQSGIEAWFEDGGEDGYCWPVRISNDEEED